MATILKAGKPENERRDDDTRVRGIVEGILGDIEARGDAAMCELSPKFDGREPDSFRLSEQDIEAALLLHASAIAFPVVKFAGVACLLYLTGSMWRAGGEADGGQAGLVRAVSLLLPLSFTLCRHHDPRPCR